MQLRSQKYATDIRELDAKIPDTIEDTWFPTQRSNHHHSWLDPRHRLDECLGAGGASHKAECWVETGKDRQRTMDVRVFIDGQHANQNDTRSTRGRLLPFSRRDHRWAILFPTRFRVTINLQVASPRLLMELCSPLLPREPRFCDAHIVRILKLMCQREPPTHFTASVLSFVS